MPKSSHEWVVETINTNQTCSGLWHYFTHIIHSLMIDDQGYNQNQSSLSTINLLMLGGWDHSPITSMAVSGTDLLEVPTIF